ncbi:MAG: transcriptional regulator [Spirochaetales bacterium]|nr:transcriptional regulator [Spirochaetales bacterium]
MNKELYTQFDPVFFEKTRLSMLTILHSEEAVSFNKFKKLLGGTDGSIYSHIQKLIKAGYIEQHKSIFKDRQQTQYSLTEKGKSTFKKYIYFLENMLKTKRGRK